MVVFVFDTPPVPDSLEDLRGWFTYPTAQVDALSFGLLSAFLVGRPAMDFGDGKDAGEVYLNRCDWDVTHATDIDAPVA